MDPMSIPILPHLPAAETWRESTYPFASRRSPALQTLDYALETYENSFRRYDGISQSYYLALYVASNETERRTALVQSVAEQAEEAFSHAVHAFEAVDIAFNLWVNSGAGFAALPEVRELQTLLAIGRSVLSEHPRTRRNSKPQEPSRERRPSGKGRGARRFLSPSR